VADVNAREIARATKDLAALPRRVATDRRLRGSVVDDDPDDVSTQEGRGVPAREKVERVGKLDSGPPAAKPSGRTPDAVYTVPDAAKYSPAPEAAKYSAVPEAAARYSAVPDVAKATDRSNRGKGGGRDR
jgi:hypothetical protein